MTVGKKLIHSYVGKGYFVLEINYPFNLTRRISFKYIYKNICISICFKIYVYLNMCISVYRYVFQYMHTCIYLNMCIFKYNICI